MDSSSKQLNFIGVGGCGRKLLKELILRNYQDGTHRFSNYIFYDLSEDCDYIFQEIPPDLEYRDIKPAKLGGGAGRVPISAEFIAQNLEELFRLPRNLFIPQIANIYLHSLGGGTGSGTVPVLIRESRNWAQYGIQISISVLTQGSLLENVNPLYTFPQINSSADLVILTENRRMENLLRSRDPGLTKMPLELINPHITTIVDLIAGARKPGAYPGIQDFKNYVNLLSSHPLYHEGIRWLIPFVWPPLGMDFERDYTRYMPLGWILKALKLGGMCEGADYSQAQLGILILEAPFQGYLSQVEMHETIAELESLLDMDPGSIVYTLIPNPHGLRLCLLLYPLSFSGLSKLAELDSRSLERVARAWESGAERDLKELSREIPIHPQFIQQARDYIRSKLGELDQRERIRELMQLLES